MSKTGLGEFELIVLLAVLQLGEDDAHALAIVDTIKERTGRSVQRAAVYVTLQRLENKGHVSSWLSEPRPERGGKGRRHYKVGRAGLRAVQTARAAFESMWNGLALAGGR